MRDLTPNPHYLRYRLTDKEKIQVSLDIIT